MQLVDFNIKWIGFGGITVDKLDWKTYKVCQVQPDIVILDIGTNDLSNRDVCPRSLAREVFELACSLTRVVDSVKAVYVMNIFPRDPYSRYPARQDFNDCVETYNEELTAYCTASDMDIYPVSMKRVTDYDKYLSKDGVHLTQTPSTTTHSGMFHYVMAIRRSLVKGARLLSFL